MRKCCSPACLTRGRHGTPPHTSHRSCQYPRSDCSGVTYREGIYHVWHQCCQNHWDHVISKDLVHWQRLPPPVQPVTLKTCADLDEAISTIP